MVVCEASAADCLYRSAVQADGNLVNVTGDLQTIMAGLACGEGNTIGWDILKNHVTVFASVETDESASSSHIAKDISHWVNLNFIKAKLHRIMKQI